MDLVLACTTPIPTPIHRLTSVEVAGIAALQDEVECDAGGDGDDQRGHAVGPKKWWGFH